MYIQTATVYKTPANLLCDLLILLCGNFRMVCLIDQTDCIRISVFHNKINRKAGNKFHQLFKALLYKKIFQFLIHTVTLFYL